MVIIRTKKWLLLFGLAMTLCFVQALPAFAAVVEATAVEEAIEANAVDEAIESGEELDSKDTENTSTLAQSLHIQAKVGYNGQYVQGLNAPVQFTVTNHYNRNIKGELVLHIVNDRGLSVAHILPIEIAQGSTVEASMTVEGSFIEKKNSIQFYEGGVDRGQQLKITGDKHAIGKSTNTAATIGIVANDPDTLNFVAFLNNQGFSISPIVLDPSFKAESLYSLEMFTFLVINDVATLDWPAEKVKAITDWVANGGTLLLGGGAGYAQTAAAFSSLTPVEGSTTRIWEQSSMLSDYVGSTEELQPLPVVDGKLVKGQVILQDGNTPITAVAKFGHGSVYYAAFDLGLKPFSIWEGRTAFIQALLSEKMMLAGTVSKSNYLWSLENSANYFPRLHPPKVSGLLIIFFIYIMIVAPILYIVLKRLDRREWSWWIIPSLAVLSTLIIVFVGAKDKSGYYANGIRVAMVNDNVTRELGVNNIFIPNNKDITISMPEHVQASILMGNSVTSSNSDVNTSKQQRIYHRTPSQEVMFTNNKYWTMKSLMLQEKIYDSEQYGMITATVEVNDNDEAVLKIYNETGVDLQHVSLIAISTLHYIDDLPAGETLEYKLSSSLLLKALANMNVHYNNFSNELYQGAGVDWGTLEREQYVLDNTAFFPNTASIVAFSYSDEPSYVINGKQVKSDEMKMWVVNVEQQLTDSLWDQQLIAPDRVDVGRGDYSVNNDANQYFTLVEGTIELHYTLPASPEPQELAEIFPKPSQNYGSVVTEIYNVQTGQWDVINTGAGAFELRPYVDEWKVVKVKLDSGNQYYEGLLPRLLLDREVQS